MKERRIVERGNVEKETETWEICRKKGRIEWDEEKESENERMRER